MNGTAKENVQTFNDVDVIYNHSAYYSFTNKSPKAFRKPQKTFIDQLAKLITFGNSVTLTRTEWCRVLSTSDKNLTRKLHLLAGDLCIVDTPRSGCNVPLGSVKVSVSPAYLFVGTASERDLTLIEWYVDKGYEAFQASCDWFVSEAYQSSFQHF